MTRTPVHSVADSLKIPVFTPASLRDVEAQKIFNSLVADVAVVVAYGLILPIPVLKAPRFVPESPRFIATALARCRANPASDYGRRLADRH